MKVGILFSGGKDSVYASFLAQEFGHEIGCLISVFSENKDSYMFHTPSIEKTKKQAEVMGVPLVMQESKGEKEKELRDLEKAIRFAVRKYKIKGIVTGAVQSVYQSSRIQAICNKLKLECFNPLWQIDEDVYLKDLLKNKFEIIITGIFAYPLDEKWLGRKINRNFVEEIGKLNEKFHISKIGEGGEFESFVLDCPLFSRALKVKSFKDFQEGKNSFRREVEVE